MKQKFKFIRLVPAFFCLLICMTPTFVLADQKKQTDVEEVENIPRVPKPILPKNPGIPGPAAVPNVAEIQKELQEILQAHRSLQAQHVQQVKEIQRITEQAKVHQELLKKLSVPPARVKPLPDTGVDVEESLRLQKIRLIQQEARKNRVALESLRQQVKEEKAQAKKGEEKKDQEEPSPAPSSTSKEKPKGKPKKSFWW